MAPKDAKPFETGLSPPREKVKKDEPKYQTAVEALCEQTLRGPVRQEYVGELLSPIERLCEEPPKVEEKGTPQGRERGQEQDELVVEVFGPKHEATYRPLKGV